MEKIELIRPENDLFNLERHLMNIDLALDSYLLDKQKNPLVGTSEIDETFSRFSELHLGKRTFVSFTPNAIIFPNEIKSQSDANKRWVATCKALCSNVKFYCEKIKRKSELFPKLPIWLRTRCEFVNEYFYDYFIEYLLKDELLNGIDFSNLPAKKSSML